MSKVIRISDAMISKLEEYRSARIERCKLLLSVCDGYQADIKRYEELSYTELADDCIISALVNAEIDLKNLSQCLK